MTMNLTLQNKGSFLTRFLLIGVFLLTLSMPTWAQEKITVSGKIGTVGKCLKSFQLS